MAATKGGRGRFPLPSKINLGEGEIRPPAGTPGCDSNHLEPPCVKLGRTFEGRSAVHPACRPRGILFGPRQEMAALRLLNASGQNEKAPTLSGLASRELEWRGVWDKVRTYIFTNLALPNPIREADMGQMIGRGKREVECFSAGGYYQDAR